MLTVACFFIVASTGLSQTLPGGQTVRTVLAFGVVIVAIFSVVFLYYNNSFLIKRRKKELGLYNILGMEKRHIAKVMAWETLFSALIAIVGGLVVGMLLDRLMFLLLLNLIHFDVNMAYAIQPSTIALTVVLFGAIFLLILLSNLAQVVVAKPIELLRGGNVGEKEPKTRWLLVLIGVLSLGTGYYLALTTTQITKAVGIFFIAVLLVIIGTYCLFLAGSIAVLKMLKKRKNYYYKANHFISVSGMLYRMKQNAVGLANICILSTMVLVTVACTVSLYGGINDVIADSYPHDISAQFFEPTEHCRSELENIIAETEQETGISAQRVVIYSDLTRYWLLDNDGSALVTPVDKVDDPRSTGYFSIISAADWEQLTGQHYELSGHEVALGEAAGTLPDTFSVEGEQFTVKTRFPVQERDLPMSHYIADMLIYIIVPDDATLVQLYQLYNADTEEDGRNSRPTLRLNLDVGGTTEQNRYFTNQLSAHISDATAYDEASGEQPLVSHGWTYTTKADNVDAIYSLYGGFLFLGILLGILFLMATVLIIYYKQIIEGYDDRARFEILQKVGMDKRLIASSVHSQILTMFLLPLGVAALHLVFAFPLLNRVLQAMELNNTALFLRCTLATFAAFVAVYLIVYAFTSRVYYRIISGRESR